MNINRGYAMSSSDYRQSHQDPAMASAYHRRFYANPYRAMMWEFERSFLDEIVADKFGGQPIRHLDFACGTGRILQHLEDVSSSATGVDVSEAMLSIARELVPGAELLTADITQSDLLSGRQFDLITAFRFFPNAQPELREAAIGALAKHLAPSAVLVFNNHKNRHSVLYALTRIMRMGRQRDMSHQDVVRLVSGAGLSITRTFHVGLVPAAEKVRPLPTFLLRQIERALANFRVLRWLSSNTIYVCEKNSGARSGIASR
jgi:SAM-dependent methyltransferase